MWLSTACGGSIDRHPHYDEQENPPAAQSGASLWPGDSANLLVTLEHRGQTFSLFHLDPFTVLTTQPLPLAESAELIYPSQDGQYFVAASPSSYGVVQASGAVNTNPTPLTGAPQSLAFSPTYNFAVVADDQQTMVLLQMNAGGSVIGSWKTSTKFPNGQYALSGTMLANGNYLATLSGSSVAVVDIAQSITSQAWVARSFDVSGTTNMTWAAMIPGLGFNAVLIQDGNNLLTVNTDSSAIIDSKNFGSASVLWQANDASPHLITQTEAEVSTQRNDLYYVTSTGKIAMVSFAGTSEQMLATWLDPAGGTLAVAYNSGLTVNSGSDPYSALNVPRVVARFHTADGSAVDTSPLSDTVHVKVRANYIFTTYPSPLGKSERLTYGPSPVTLTELRYAFPAISRRHR